jgi:hypothetical protein
MPLTVEDGSDDFFLERNKLAKLTGEWRPFYIVARATPPAVVESKVSRFEGVSWLAIFDLLSLPGNRDRQKQLLVRSGN